MGRHAEPLDGDRQGGGDRDGKGARSELPGPAELLGWGCFATAVATPLIVLIGGGWGRAVPVAALGLGITGLLAALGWAARRVK
jgi:hypothetical protein